MGKHSLSKRPKRTPGRGKENSTASRIAVLELVSGVIILAAALVDLVTAIVHTGH
ncbi:hypothetical protein G7Y31_10440 [Corynebacterium lizhenjunii]|uniref:Uncharacterized protein n=1 Tax=Corynebacterium lizhenjunii TaxID=2709394 RepID=A0A7T0PBU0_9CORY|nr:hypothetical protein [Corynebacterium lizhenjunii]QPK78917.1 hypothetical protein G7Y31_10440 [Corynebacterium lizhenjunii]